METWAAPEEVARVLIVLGVALVIFEVLVPGGIAGFIGGASALFGLYSLGVLPAVWAIVTLVLFTFGLVAFAIPGIRARNNPIQQGAETLVGAIGEARSDIAPEGTVAARGTLWTARATSGSIPSGSKVRVSATDGLVLVVEPASETGEGR